MQIGCTEAELVIPIRRRALLPQIELAHPVDRVLGRGEDAPGVGQKDLARRVQRDPLWPPVEQLDPDFLFELLDLLAQRRLFHPQPHRGAGDVLFLGDRHEIAQMAKFHERPSSGVAAWAAQGAIRHFICRKYQNSQLWPFSPQDRW